MRRILRHRPSPAMVIACIALTVALGGTSYAAVTLPRGSVGTAQLKKNAVISAKVKNRSLLAVDFKLGQLPRGARGPQGLPGATGATGAAGAKGDKGDKGDQGIQGPMGPGARWAAVNGATGAIVDQSGGLTVTDNQTGRYWVDFGTDVTRKLILVSLRDFSGQSQAIACAGPSGAGSCYGTPEDLERVYIQTRDAAGAAANRNFYIVMMGPDGTGTTGAGSKADSRPTGPAVP
jgi:collagen triple helix repeat protein